MIVIVEVTYEKPLKEVDRYLAEHREFLKTCYAKNLLLASGPQEPRKGGVIIALGSLESVKKLMQEDPFQKKKIASYRFIPFEPVLHAKVLAPLMKKNKPLPGLNFTEFETPLGTLLGIADEQALHHLAFIEKGDVLWEIERLQKEMKATLNPGKTSPLILLEKELKAYFKGTLKMFKTPLYMEGSAFQKQAWDAVLDVPYGETRSYLEQAMAVGNSRAYRAVANANGANQLIIVVPCHRIINNNGELGGYGSGLHRKQWLLDHEKKHSKKQNELIK